MNSRTATLIETAAGLALLAGFVLIGRNNFLLSPTLKQSEKRLREERDRIQRYLDIAGVILPVLDREPGSFPRREGLTAGRTVHKGWPKRK